MYFFVNASSPEPLDIATPKLQVLWSDDVDATGQHIV